MTDIVLFHHALGRTTGMELIADRIGQAGHRVHLPDLYAGHTFGDLEAGVGHAGQVGFGTIIDRGVASVDELDRLDQPDGAVVFAGVSLGVLPAQRLAQTRPGALGAILIAACVPPTEFADGWPDGVPIQVHGMDADPFFAGEGDLDVARALVADHDDRELFTYPGDGHLFMDATTTDHDEAATALVVERVVAFLDRLDT